MIKAMHKHEREELEEEVKAARVTIREQQDAYTLLLYKTEQNRLDTALAASLERTLHSLCRRIINRKGATPIAKAWLEGE